MNAHRSYAHKNAVQTPGPMNLDEPANLVADDEPLSDEERDFVDNNHFDPAVPQPELEAMFEDLDWEDENTPPLSPDSDPDQEPQVPNTNVQATLELEEDRRHGKRGDLGETAWQLQRKNEMAPENPHWPFWDAREWSFALHLALSSESHQWLNGLLKSDMVCCVVIPGHRAER